MLPRLIHQDTAGVAPDRNFDKRTITDPLSSRSSKIFRLLLSRRWTILILPPKFCLMSTCKRQEPPSAIDLQLKQLSFTLSFLVINILWRLSYIYIYICKVKFNQSSYWLYSVPNLLVFQHLVTLYLGGFVVRVVSEIEC